MAEVCQGMLAPSARNGGRVGAGWGLAGMCYGAANHCASFTRLLCLTVEQADEHNPGFWNCTVKHLLQRWAHLHLGTGRCGQWATGELKRRLLGSRQQCSPGQPTAALDAKHPARLAARCGQRSGVVDCPPSALCSSGDSLIAVGGLLI
jgi:hypothetical protein